MPAPLVILAYVAGSALIGAIGNRVRKTKLKIAVIGPEEGGKTTFVELLKKGCVKDEAYRQTNLSESLPEFEAFWTKKNKLRRVDIAVNSDVGIKTFFKDFKPGMRYGGKDIPGDKGLMSEYKKLLEKKDFSFFFFNIQRYFDEDGYKNDVNCRFDFLTDYLHQDGIIVVATHIDKIDGNINVISQKFKDMIKEKPYAGVLKNVKYINLLDCNAGSEIRKCFGDHGEK